MVEKVFAGQVLTSLDPRWTAPIYRVTTGQDFLGLRAVQENIVGYLVPGIITTTPRARHYAFCSWLLVEYGRSHPPGVSLSAFIRRREQIFVLANLAWCDSSDGGSGEGGLLGSEKLGRHWRAFHRSDVIPLTVDDYLKAKYGGYTLYRGVMQALGITRQLDSGALEVSSRGQELAQAFSAVVQDTRYFAQRHALDTATSVARDLLQEYGARCRLSGLAAAPDCLPTLDTLFASDVDEILPSPETGHSSVGNMKGTLGLILDLIDQARGPFGDDEFRQGIAYGLCSDFDQYRPSEALRPMVSHWQMFQLREYYVHAFYALWVYFLDWLRLRGPQTLRAFYRHLDDRVDLATTLTSIGLDVPHRSPDDWPLAEWLDALLDGCGVRGNVWKQRCNAFARCSGLPLNEHAIYRLLCNTGPNDISAYFSLVWLLLSALFLRLQGLQDLGPHSAWHWAELGGARRRSMALFVRDIQSHLEAKATLLDVWKWLLRDYIVAQHIITALEKWRQRGANTFHFQYDEGCLEWLRDGATGLSGSRFRQAYDMLADLGLYEIDSESDGRPQLTELGRSTLRKVCEACVD